MTENRRTVGWLALLALSSLLATGSVFAQDAGRPRATFDLTASEVAIDEGDIVQFNIENKKYLHPSTGDELEFEADLSPVRWDFGGDRTGPAEAYGLYNIRHWFSSNESSPRVVRATHQGTTEEITVTIRNVVPAIHAVHVTEHPLTGEPTVFQAVARDPGWSDELTFSWDFGDGARATGQNAIHTYASAGAYRVTLSVADEEGRDEPEAVQGGEFTVTVRDIPAANTISVSGDISEPEADIENVIVVGSNGNPMNPGVAGPCQIRLELRTGRDDMFITLTAQLTPGFVPGNYTIGKTREWDGMHQDDSASRGTFFADFSPPRYLQMRSFGGRSVGGPFWSDQGRLAITRFDSGVLELDFEAELTENIPGSFEPRKVFVRGAVSTTVGETPDFGDSRGGPDIGAAISDMFGDAAQGGATMKGYFCPGEEPEEFEVVASNPLANAISAAYEDNAVALQFSQAVDSDSLVDPETLQTNLELYVRDAAGGRHHPRGGWVVSAQNPTVVQFIPQARLLPGTVFCVTANGGEDGVRSFGGNVLAGSSLEPPSADFARACDPVRENQVGFAFSTRVELESVWVDVYNASLLGPHAKALPGLPYIARVYSWWQNAWKNVHRVAQVREFPANVFAVQDRAAMEPMGGDRGPVSTRLKRPDLYVAEQRRTMSHTAQFSSIAPATGSVEISAVVQMKTRHGQPIDPVFPSVPTQIGIRNPAGQHFGVGSIKVEGLCAGGQTEEQCGWGGPWDDSWKEMARQADDHFLGSLRRWLPVELMAFTRQSSESYETTLVCPDGYTDGVCPGDLDAGIARLVENI